MWRAAVVLGLFSLSVGCASSAEEQRSAQTHQQSADVAAREGTYQLAADEQRKAEEAHHRAVKKAAEEGAPIPPQPSPDVPVSPR